MYPERQFCMIVDEIDAFARRDDDKSGSSGDIDLLYAFQNLMDRHNHPNFRVLATTNYVGKLPAAFVRDGRLTPIYVGYLGYEDRKYHLGEYLKNVDQKVVNEVLYKTVNFTKADMIEFGESLTRKPVQEKTKHASFVFSPSILEKATHGLCDNPVQLHRGLFC
jgi:SpoVK/Ycf46/Vps4 family AAA+-type ATPase